MEEKETESKCKNKRRFGDGFCQIHLEVPLELKEKLEEQERNRKLSRAAYVTMVLQQAFDNGGEIQPSIDSALPQRLENFENRVENIESKLCNIESKIDTVIALIAKL